MTEPERKPPVPPQMLDVPAADQIEQAALQLPPDARAALAVRLLDSLDPRSSVSEGWDEELRRRVEAVRSGRAKTRPVEEFLAELEERTR